MKKIYEYEAPHITGFDAPSIASWPIGSPQQIFALLNTSPSAEWRVAFEEEIKVSIDLIRQAHPVLQGDQIALFASPSNVGSTRMALTKMLRSVESRYREHAEDAHHLSDWAQDGH